MDILTIASALAFAALVVPLAIIVIGIHRQERAGLASRHAGLCAAVARNVTALHATPLSPASRPHAIPSAARTPHRKPSTTDSGGNSAPAQPPVLAAGGRS
jgi:hypothetical protein